VSGVRITPGPPPNQRLGAAVVCLGGNWLRGVAFGSLPLNHAPEHGLGDAEDPSGRLGEAQRVALQRRGLAVSVDEREAEGGGQ